MQKFTLLARADWPRPGLPSLAESCAMRLAPALFTLPLTGWFEVNGPNQGNSSPLTVSSPDLPGGTFLREFTCDGANRRVAKPRG